MIKTITKFILGFLILLSLIFSGSAQVDFPVSFTGFSEGTIDAPGADTDGDGLFDHLLIDAGIDVTAADSYSFTASLEDQNGNLITTSSVEADYGIGAHTVSFSFSGKEIYFKETDGPYSLSVEVYGVLTDDEDFDDLYSTSKYDYTDFEPISVEDYVIAQDIDSYVFEGLMYDDGEGIEGSYYIAAYSKADDEHLYGAYVFEFIFEAEKTEFLADTIALGFELEIIEGSLVYTYEEVEDTLELEESKVLWIHEGFGVWITTEYGSGVEERIVPTAIVEAYLAKYSSDFNEPVTEDYDIPELPDDLRSVTGFYINEATYGRIDFGATELDLTNVVDLDSNVLISDNLIGINTAVFSELNKPATLTMNGLTFDETPAVYYTSSFTSNPGDVRTLCDFCTVQSYENGVLIFTVDHFSTFSAGEQPKLVISDLDVDVDGEKDRNMNDGETISKEAEPGSVVELSIKVSNEHDFDLEDVRVEATLRNIGEDNDNLEEESDEFDLDDGDDERVELEFDIPLKVEDKDYTITIDVRGEDKDGTRYSTEWTIYLEVEKEKHNVVISKAELSATTVRCESKVYLDFEVTNIGRNSEDEVVVEVISSELGGLLFKKTEIDLDDDIDEDDNDYSETISFDIPEDLVEDTYPVIIKAYYDIDRLSDTKTLSLVKEECKIVVEEEEEPVEVIIEPPEQVKPVETAKEAVSFEYMLFLAASCLVVLSLLVFGVAYLIIKK